MTTERDLNPGFYYVRPIYPEPRQPWTVGELRPARPNFLAYWVLVGSDDSIYQYGDKLVNDELDIGPFLNPQPQEWFDGVSEGAVIDIGRLDPQPGEKAK